MMMFDLGKQLLAGETCKESGKNKLMLEHTALFDWLTVVFYNTKNGVAREFTISEDGTTEELIDNKPVPMEAKRIDAFRDWMKETFKEMN